MHLSLGLFHVLELGSKLPQVSGLAFLHLEHLLVERVVLLHDPLVLLLEWLLLYLN